MVWCIRNIIKNSAVRMHRNGFFISRSKSDMEPLVLKRTSVMDIFFLITWNSNVCVKMY